MKISALSLLLFIFCCTSCRLMGGKRINGNGNVKAETRQVGSFSGVSVKGGVDIMVSEGANEFKIEADENLMPYIIVENRGGTVDVYSKSGYNLDSRSGIKVYAAAPQFSNIEVSGSGDVRSVSGIKGNHLKIEIKGSGDVRMEVEAPSIVTGIAGSGSIRLNGKTRDFTADIKGSGDIHCFDLLSENTSVDIAGSGNAEVFASKKLNVDIKGAGDVAYKGTAAVTKNIMGSGNIRKVN